MTLKISAILTLLIKTLVRSSSSSHHLFQGESSISKPRCAIVGTFYDKISHDRFKEIDGQLQNSLQFSKIMIRLMQFGDDKVIFPVNTLDDKKKERKRLLFFVK